MLDELGDERIFQAQSPSPKSAVNKLPWETILDPALSKGCLKNGLHDLVDLASCHRCGHQGILDCLHDGGSKAVPSLRWLKLLGPQCISPFDSLASQIPHFVLHAAVWTDLNPQRLTSLIDFQPLIYKLAILKV